MRDDQTAELLKCPFCCGDAYINQNPETGWWILHHHCHFVGDIRLDWTVPREQLISSWNTRVRHPTPSDQAAGMTPEERELLQATVGAVQGVLRFSDLIMGRQSVGGYHGIGAGATTGDPLLSTHLGALLGKAGFK